MLICIMCASFWTRLVSCPDSTLSRGKGSGDHWPIPWLCRVSSLDTEQPNEIALRHATTCSTDRPICGIVPRPHPHLCYATTVTNGILLLCLCRKVWKRVCVKWPAIKTDVCETQGCMATPTWKRKYEEVHWSLWLSLVPASQYRPTVHCAKAFFNTHFTRHKWQHWRFQRSLTN